MTTTGIKVTLGGKKEAATEEEKKLQDKYELLRKLREKKKQQEQGQGAAQDEAGGAAAAAEAPAGAAAAQQSAAAPSAPASSAQHDKAAAAASTAKQAAKDAAPAAEPAAKTQLPAGAAPPKKVISAAEAAARLAKAGALPSPAGASAEQTPARPGAGLKRPGGHAAPAAADADASTPAPDAPHTAGAAAARKRPVARRPATEPKRPRHDPADDVSRLWDRARGEGGGGESASGRGGHGHGGHGGGGDGGDPRARRVVVTGLPAHADDNDLKMAMIAFGRVAEARVLDQGGVGFVLFHEATAAEDAIEATAPPADGRPPKQPLLVAGGAVSVEWPREQPAAGGGALPPGMEGAAFVMLPPEMQKEHQRKLDMEQMAAVAKFYTQGGVLPSLPKGPDRDVVDYSDLL